MLQTHAIRSTLCYCGHVTLFEASSFAAEASSSAAWDESGKILGRSGPDLAFPFQKACELSTCVKDCGFEQAVTRSVYKCVKRGSFVMHAREAPFVVLTKCCFTG